MTSGVRDNYTLNQLLLRLISYRLFVPLMIVGLAVFAGAGYLGEVRIVAQQHLVTHSTVRMVERYLDHGARILDAVARASEEATAKNRALFMSTTLAAYGYFDTLYYLDKSNKITLMVPPDRRYLGLDLSNLPYYHQAGQWKADKSGLIISRPFISIRTGAPTVYLIKIVPGGGAMIGELSLGALQNEIMSGTGRSAKGLVYIMDQSGMLLAHPAEKLVKQRTNLSNLEIFRRALQGDTTLVFNYDGKWVLGSADRIERGGWVVITQVPLSVAFGPYAWTLGLTLLATLGIWLALAWNLRKQLQHHVVTPLVRLSQGTTALANGDFSKGVVKAAMPAPFAELNRLTADFQHMSSALEARQASLQESEERYRSLFDRVPAGLFRSTPDGRILDVNHASVLILGYPDREALLRVNSTDLWITHEERRLWQAEVVKEGVVREFTTQLLRFNGTAIWARLNTRAVKDSEGGVQYFEGTLEDISEQRRAEEDRTRLEVQLRQSQKMESVGLLAGGIAHDFNNLLTPILGYSELLLVGLPEKDSRRKKLQRIREAAELAKDLTHRLLAFSRKQILELKTVDLGEITRRFENMLRRTIHENIRIEVRVSPSPGLVRADKGQIEQALLNLAINGQDAMPDGGTLTIEVMDIFLDESFTSKHPGIAPGPYVMLVVSDNGEGMDEQTIGHIFEPFFTTKELGRGTGLGLSTVYGIVKQHGGLISVFSEKKRGSTFKIFLPAVAEGVKNIEVHPYRADEVAHGVETIMVVEDNEMARKLACDMLGGLGYRVIPTESPERCIELMNELESPINLLLTDVVMPNMNGRQLFELLRGMKPGLKVLFMSGYAGNVIGQHGVLDEGMHFVQKPFTMLTLSQKVRHVLDS